MCWVMNEIVLRDVGVSKAAIDMKLGDLANKDPRDPGTQKINGFHLKYTNVCQNRLPKAPYSQWLRADTV